MSAAPALILRDSRILQAQVDAAEQARLPYMLVSYEKMRLDSVACFFGWRGWDVVSVDWSEERLLLRRRSWHPPE